MADRQVEVLVVGAGPTGLALAAQLAAHGVVPRLIDRGRYRVRESRALAIQPRTLEVLAGLGVTDELVECGNPATELRLHARHRERALPLFDLGLVDTAYPFLLFLSQAETERILEERLRQAGVQVERGVELVGLDPAPDGCAATMRHPDGREARVLARYAVGCDGAHSAVRRLAGIEFAGSAYPQTFVLADTEADGIEPGAAHVFVSRDGMLLCFPLGAPASWRVVAMRPRTDPTPPDAAVELPEVQALADTFTGGAVRLRDPVWITNFRLQHRAAASYRSGQVFIAGDAAHIHSPAGAQGMNTGIQDAINLGWKLGYAVRGAAPPALLETYDPERVPVGRMVLRFTDRAFVIATSRNPVVGFARTRVAPALMPLVWAAGPARAYAFRTLSQLRIRYRHSPLSVEGRGAPRGGPRAGDRLPDAPVTQDGHGTTLHRVTGPPGWHLLRCGLDGEWTPLDRHYAGRVTAHDLDVDGEARHRLGVAAGRTALYLVRPDGHVGYRSEGSDRAGLARYLERWLPLASP